MNRFFGLGLVVAATAVAANWGPLKQQLERWMQPQAAAALLKPQAQVMPHKCIKRDGSVLYTTEPCEAGQRQQAASGGSVNVVAMPKAPAPAASGAEGGLLKQISGPPLDPKAKERAMDRTMEGGSR